ncbi:VOC family protein [Pacificoceanicola onchidii]|uniref:VOC family protein n=1 Tax=Pacificoceanicola onchidii TaxID=2562685 RepID=UPI001455E642|nr:VOC family protein [Pacificoceanicola onchidii]
MQVTSLFHISFKTQKPKASVRFYKEVLGMEEAPRPPFDFPGFWLKLNTSQGEVPLHLYTDDVALNDDGSIPEGTGVIDHLAFSAHGFQETRDRCARLGVEYRERSVPSLSLVQLFLYDPNGIQIELNFNANSEEPLPEINPANTPGVGSTWFTPQMVAQWGQD